MECPTSTPHLQIKVPSYLIFKDISLSLFTKAFDGPGGGCVGEICPAVLHKVLVRHRGQCVDAGGHGARGDEEWRG